jgi:hypothetical protein
MDRPTGIFCAFGIFWIGPKARQVLTTKWTSKFGSSTASSIHLNAQQQILSLRKILEGKQLLVSLYFLSLARISSLLRNFIICRIEQLLVFKQSWQLLILRQIFVLLDHSAYESTSST